MKKRKLLRQQSTRNKKDSKYADQNKDIKHMLAQAAHTLNTHQPEITNSLCRRILALDPENAFAMNLLGLAAAQLGKYDLAEKYIRKALAEMPGSPVFNANLGILFANAGNTEEALRHFEEALHKQPDNVEILYNLIELYEKTNQLELAIKKTRMALDLSNDAKPLSYQLAKLEFRAGNHTQAKDIITDLLGRQLDQDLKFKSLHLLAQVLDRLAEYNQAFACFRQANNLLAQTPLALELEPQRQKINQLLSFQRDCFSRTLIGKWQSDLSDSNFKQDPSPVFLVGFPRSGTTLAGQVLAAHSKIITLDERQTLEPLIYEFSYPDQ